MRKGILLIVIAAIVAIVLYKFVFKKEAAEESKPQPIAIIGTDSLTVSMAAALNSYYDLKDAFVKSDTSLVNKSALAFVEKLELVKISEVKADSSLVQLAQQLLQNIDTETKKITALEGLETKRKTFQMVSDGLYDLLRTVRYGGSKVYQQYCPMAFENTGASWLSNSTDIVNPYFGAKMLHCGDVRDSIRLEGQ